MDVRVATSVISKRVISNCIFMRLQIISS